MRGEGVRWRMKERGGGKVEDEGEGRGEGGQ